MLTFLWTTQMFASTTPRGARRTQRRYFAVTPRPLGQAVGKPPARRQHHHPPRLESSHRPTTPAQNLWAQIENKRSYYMCFWTAPIEEDSAVSGGSRSRTG